MYSLAIIKCTSPLLLASWLKIFKWNFTTSPGIEPRTRWTRDRCATIWACAAWLRDKIINPILEKACQLCTEPVLYLVVYIFVRRKTMSMNVFPQLSKNLKISWGDLGCMEDVQHLIAVTHDPAIHMNMTCCVHHKQQTCNNGFLIRPLIQQSKIALHLTVLYLPPLLMFDIHMYL